MTFLVYLYFISLIAAICLAWISVFVWSTALLLLLFARTRRFAKSLCLAMLGVFPFMFTYQFLTALPLAVLLASWWYLVKSLELHAKVSHANPVVILAGVSIDFVVLGSVMIATLGGFYDGWKTGWRWGEGESFAEAIYNAPVCRGVSNLLGKLGAKLGLTRRELS